MDKQKIKDSLVSIKNNYVMPGIKYGFVFSSGAVVGVLVGIILTMSVDD